MNSSLPAKISVCIPVYNGNEHIGESINSVLAQTYENFQLIVCDNCSTDNTEEIVRNFNDLRLNYVRNEKNRCSLYEPEANGLEAASASGP